MTSSRRHLDSGILSFRLPSLASPPLRILGKAALAVLCLAAMSWSLLEALLLIDQLPWKYVRWGLVLDEQNGYGQIWYFLHGRFELFRWPGEAYAGIAMLPGFHALMAAISYVTGLSTPRSVRLQCFGVSLVYAAVAYALARREVGRERAPLRAAQAYFLPVAFPFHFLIYTDILSLAVCLGALLACMQQRWNTCGLLAILALLVRQTNVVFLGFLFAYSSIELYGGRISIGAFARHAARCWPLCVGIAAFAAFVAIHGRVGLDDPTQHPLVASVGNLRFSLLCCGVLFLPWHAGRVSELGGWARRQWPTALALALAALGLTFAEGRWHPWNIKLNFLFRNEVLAWMISSWGARLTTFDAILVALWSLAATPLARPASYTLYPYWVLALVPVWLIEPRYHILPFALLVLLRKPVPIAAEVALLLWFMGWSLFLWNGVTHAGFLP